MNHDKHVMRIISTANFLGKVLLMSGAETHRVEQSISKVCQRFGLRSESFVTTTCVLTSAKKQNGEIVTELNRVYNLSNNLNKIDKIHTIVLNIENYDLEALESEIKKIQSESIYRSYIILISYFFAAAFFALLFKGSFLDAIVAGFGGAFIFYMMRFASKIKVNNFFINTLGGFIVTIFAAFVKKINIIENASYSTIAILMLLVPGLALTNAIRDLINGDFIAGNSRMVEAFLIGGALAIGTGFGLAIAY
ncbi:MAG: threonine/serine exporter family protein [Fusobacterium gastrosuis]|uniref:threonine/serine exporter family protein n=1 Tax=Fusobacterium TaxID=848 RepID=UPI001F4FE10B|nr:MULTISPECIES: threonine/serine exporter family protein [Fusobacterium]MDD7392432.1 threonine/serine exporter family protein [Fusobacteriaceae bacterium]MCI5725582.1 threonine/serine exporter family protein [Fusobacterium sp.]MCI7224071.1 threonine/serine exporter family protein [Fusobacterium sp.]MDD7410522.1 threonine/serine exporter family protein [Fusobacteriaceae bacterium]MDY4010726.1 threonine/serine exporter family protein [Fusobacterium gastrosuis]